MTTTTKLLNSYSTLNSYGQDFLTAIAEAVAFGYKSAQNTTTQTNTTRAEERKKERREER